MAYRNSDSQSVHDSVLRASRNTYIELEKQGYKVSTNPNGEQNRSVGGTKKLYPDVIVWRPATEDPNRGTAVIIEEIETEDSVNINEVQQWREYASLGVSKFYLIVPSNRAKEALQLVQQHQVGVSEIWYYSYMGSSITFTKYIALR